LQNIAERCSSQRAIPGIASGKAIPVEREIRYAGLLIVGIGPMAPPAARATDQVLQSGPHCHAPMHPAALVPTPVPHPPMPLEILPGSPNVMINGLPAARASDQTQPCMIPVCVPGGPGMIAKGSATVMINDMPAARLGDPTTHVACVGPIPGPSGTIIGPGSPTVMIGG
jgi:uncharacterized Zn-binding protein involved in type VI secretion